MRLILLTVIGLMAGLGLAAAIVVPVMAEKGPLRATLVAHLGGAQENQVPGGGDPNGRGRAVVKVFKEQLCGRVKTGAIESSSLKATINLGMSGEVGPTVANLEERAARTPLAESTTPTTTTSTTGATGAQQTGTTTTGDSTSSPQATTTQQSTTGSQSSLSQSTASPTASASASASPSASASASAASTSTASTSRATIHEHTGGCVEVPRALSLELLEHPARFYVNLSNEQSPEGAIRGQLHKKGGAGEHRSGNDAD